ncbi:hypothetical protein HMPREF0724_12682 [Prescottella equi ATCC 33707]|uniref:Uncharacterized protein n=1 Tax=Prescottella equi ATCC 33707 TaxID=525370 RepID=E9T2A5_RHOHA|nr:hypothetical protein HMPREF0724_12682 [Prescottella equi ATCC 33707]
MAIAERFAYLIPGQSDTDTDPAATFTGQRGKTRLYGERLAVADTPSGRRFASASGAG